MATLKGPTLFFVTSPRTPSKMRPEIALLTQAFGGKRWTANPGLQAAFMECLAKTPEFEGAYDPKDPAFSARDRITRGPKALGFVRLDRIELTPAGTAFLDDDTAAEALLRQLLKFQLPSPFHKSNGAGGHFCVRPYLEVLRLIDVLGRLSFDELTLFGMQLTDWHHFEAIVEAIRRFRMEKEKYRGRYRQFLGEVRTRIIKEVFCREIEAGKIKTRESGKVSLDKFVKTKASNLRDYADACLRYLRATGLVTVSNPGRTIALIEARRKEVAYLLATVDRNPVFVSDEKAYCQYLFDSTQPVLLTDNRAELEAKAIACAAVQDAAEAGGLATAELKKRIRYRHDAQRSSVVEAQVTELKTFAKYEEVLDLFQRIRARDVYDPPLAFEWNVWRTMTMLDGGEIRANLVFDDAGNPLSTAPGNAADIVCDYGSFIVTVEVTLTSGARQFEAEGESVARHLGEIKRKTGKAAYCLVVAPTINPALVAHCYVLHQTDVRFYGGKAIVVPLTLAQLISMLKQSKESGYIPSPEKIRAFCEYSRQCATEAANEEAWHEAISQKVEAWLS